VVDWLVSQRRHRQMFFYGASASFVQRVNKRDDVIHC